MWQVPCQSLSLAISIYLAGYKTFQNSSNAINLHHQSSCNTFLFDAKSDNKMASDRVSRSKSDAGHRYAASIDHPFNAGKGQQINGHVYGNVYSGKDFLSLMVSMPQA